MRDLRAHEYEGPSTAALPSIALLVRAVLNVRTDCDATPALDKLYTAIMGTVCHDAATLKRLHTAILAACFQDGKDTP